ncbi:MAG: hypothetical protein Q4B85_13250 [Lachnospiraceae bacterium]|nr:hypothetical protein [Lachnospiraceae bacterium]
MVKKYIKTEDCEISNCKRRRNMVAAILLVISLCGCVANGSTKNNESEWSDNNTQAFLTEHSWVYHNEICDETIVFGKDGSFAYYCGCGEPVGNSDLYDSYEYDSKKKEIVLKADDSLNSSECIKVLRIEKMRIILEIGGTEKEFTA